VKIGKADDKALNSFDRRRRREHRKLKTSRTGEIFSWICNAWCGSCRQCSL